MSDDLETLVGLLEQVWIDDSISPTRIYVPFRLIRGVNRRLMRKRQYRRWRGKFNAQQRNIRNTMRACHLKENGE